MNVNPRSQDITDLLRGPLSNVVDGLFQTSNVIAGFSTFLLALRIRHLTLFKVMTRNKSCHFEKLILVSTGLEPSLSYDVSLIRSRTFYITLPHRLPYEFAALYLVHKS